MLFNYSRIFFTLAYAVIGGPSSKALAKKIAKKLGANYVDTKTHVFPDGEVKITLDQVPRGSKIVVVNSIQPPVDSNLIQTCVLLSKARLYSQHVLAVIPYLGYLRQDIEFLPGEVVTSALVAKLLKSAGASKVIVADAHSTIALAYFEIPVRNVSAVPKIAKFFKKMALNAPLVVAPDLFWANTADEFARLLGTTSTALNKQRDRKTGKIRIIPSKKTNLLHRDIILLDDMISTGTSMIKAAKYLQSQNCGRIYAACTHGILVSGAEKKIRDAGIKKIVSTNTILNKTSSIDVSDVIADAIGCW